MSEKISKLLYRLDSIQILIAIGAAFLLGVVMAYSIWGTPSENLYKRIWERIISIQPEAASNFLAISIGLLGAIVGIAIPISLSIVSENLKTYKDIWISEMFRKEFAYKYQFIIVIPTIAILLLVEFLKLYHPFFLAIAFILVVISLFLFYKFIRLIEKYSTRTEEVVLEEAKRKIDEILD